MAQEAARALSWRVAMASQSSVMHGVMCEAHSCPVDV